MKNRFKRAISLLLVLVMLMSMVTVPAAAGSEADVTLGFANGEWSDGTYTVDVVATSAADSFALGGAQFYIKYDSKTLAFESGKAGAFTETAADVMINDSVGCVAVVIMDTNVDAGKEPQNYEIESGAVLATLNFVMADADDPYIEECTTELSFEDQQTMLSYYIEEGDETTGDYTVDSAAVQSIKVAGVAPVLKNVTLTKEGEPVAEVTVAGGDAEAKTVQAKAYSKMDTDITDKVTWSITDENGDELEDDDFFIEESTGEITIGPKAKAGEYTVTASAVEGDTSGADVTATLIIKREASLLQSMKISGEKEVAVSQVKEDATETYTVVGEDQFGDEMEVTGVVWSISDYDGVSEDDVSIDKDSGELTVAYTADEGEITISAACGDVTTELTVEITKESSVETSIVVTRGGEELISEDGRYKESIMLPTENDDLINYHAVLMDQYGDRVRYYDDEYFYWSLNTYGEGVYTESSASNLTLIVTKDADASQDHTVTVRYNGIEAYIDIDLVSLDFVNPTPTVAKGIVYGMSWGEIITGFKGGQATLLDEKIDGEFYLKDDKTIPSAGEQSYEIWFRSTTDGEPDGRYDLSACTGTVTVKQREITITMDSQTRGFGEENKPFTWNITKGTMVGEDDEKELFTVIVDDVAKNAYAKGTYEINATATADNYKVTVVKGKLTITARAIDADGIEVAAIDALPYSGKAQTPAVTITDGETALVAGTDYTLAYKNNTNAGTATVTITGKGSYSGTRTVTFEITKKDITDGIEVTGIPEAVPYNGKAQTFKVVVENGTVTMKEKTDYTVIYTGNKDVGTATVTITAQGNYSGKLTREFTIEKKELEVSGPPENLTVTDQNSNKIAISWKTSLKGAVGGDKVTLVNAPTEIDLSDERYVERVGEDTGFWTGTYTVTVPYAIDSAFEANYTLKPTVITVTVEPNPVPGKVVITGLTHVDEDGKELGTVELVDGKYTIAVPEYSEEDCRNGETPYGKYMIQAEVRDQYGEKMTKGEEKNLTYVIDESVSFGAWVYPQKNKSQKLVIVPESAYGAEELALTATCKVGKIDYPLEVVNGISLSSVEEYPVYSVPVYIGGDVTERTETGDKLYLLSKDGGTFCFDMATKSCYGGNMELDQTWTADGLGAGVTIDGNAITLTQGVVADFTLNVTFTDGLEYEGTASVEVSVDSMPKPVLSMAVTSSNKSGTFTYGDSANVVVTVAHGSPMTILDGGNSKLSAKGTVVLYMDGEEIAKKAGVTVSNNMKKPVEVKFTVKSGLTVDGHSFCAEFVPATEADEAKVGVAESNTETITVNPKTLTITGLKDMKVKDDGTGKIALNTKVKLSGVVGKDDVKFVEIPAEYQLTQENRVDGKKESDWIGPWVGEFEVTNIYTIEGDAAANYTLDQPVIKVIIEKNPVPAKVVIELEPVGDAEIVDGAITVPTYTAENFKNGTVPSAQFKITAITVEDQYENPMTATATFEAVSDGISIQTDKKTKSTVLVVTPDAAGLELKATCKAGKVTKTLTAEHSFTLGKTEEYPVYCVAEYSVDGGRKITAGNEIYVSSMSKGGKLEFSLNTFGC